MIVIDFKREYFSHLENYSIFKLPEVISKIVSFRKCDAKELADEINTFYGEKNPSTVLSVIINHSNFQGVVVSYNTYKMKDGSMIVWIPEWDSWGFSYPNTFVFHGEVKE